MRLLVCLALVCAYTAAQTTPLAALIAEAEAHNPDIAAATAAWHAAQEAVAPAGALPDPQIMVQQMTVGSPLPFAGFHTSNFAYLGLSASQTLPYPGKRQLRREEAASQAATEHAHLVQMRAQIAQQVAAAYIQIAYLAHNRALLVRQQAVLAAIERQAEAQYAAATGGQAAVLAAQLEQTKLLGQLSQQTADEASAQDTLRALLDRPVEAPAVAAAPLRLTSGPFPGLEQPPAEAVAAAEVQTAARGAALARKDFDPDFQVQYMYQRTGSAFPDYYQWSVGINLPLHRKAHLEPELERAAQLQLAAQAQQRATRREDERALTTLEARAANDERLARIDQRALLPQVHATAAARLAAYGAGQGRLAEVLESERDALAIEQQYWQTVADHEQARAQMGAITGSGYE